MLDHDVSLSESGCRLSKGGVVQHCTFFLRNKDDIRLSADVVQPLATPTSFDNLLVDLFSGMGLK